MSAGREFTLQYLTALEECLHVEGVAEGEPAAFAARINEISLQRLEHALRDVSSGRLQADALDELRNNPARELTGSLTATRPIQTAAVGLAPDLGQLAMLGALLGDRVVLWNTAIPGVLYDSGGVDVEALLRFSCSALSLRHGVEMGAVVLLPHPLEWSAAYRAAHRAVRDISGLTPEFVGLLNARALLEDEVPVHPYSWLSAESNVAALHSQFVGTNDRYQPEKLAQHAALRDYVTGANVVRLRDAAPKDFFSALGSSPLAKPALRESVAPRPGESKEERALRVRQALESIELSLAQHCADVARHSLERSGRQVMRAAGALSAMGAVVALGDAVTLVGALSLAAGASAVGADTIVARVERLFGPPKTDPLTQFFVDLDELQSARAVRRVLDAVALGLGDP